MAENENKLTALNDHLFAQLSRLGDESLQPEALEKEIARTNAIVDVSEQIISNANVVLKSAELIAKHGAGNWEKMLPTGKAPSNVTAIPNYSEEKTRRG